MSLKSPKTIVIPELDSPDPPLQSLGTSLPIDSALPIPHTSWIFGCFIDPLECILVTEGLLGEGRILCGGPGTTDLSFLFQEAPGDNLRIPSYWRGGFTGDLVGPFPEVLHFSPEGLLLSHSNPACAVKYTLSGGLERRLGRLAVNVLVAESDGLGSIPGSPLEGDN